MEDKAIAFEEQLRKDFADDTAYERLVLATTVEPHKPPPGAVFAINDIRDNGPKHLTRGIHESLRADAVKSVVAQFRPLAFGRHTRSSISWLR